MGGVYSSVSAVEPPTPSAEEMSEDDDDDEVVTKELVRGTWLCEGALWLQWSNRGGLLSLEEGVFFGLEALAFADSLRNFTDIFALFRSYAYKFAMELKDYGFLSDILEIRVNFLRNSDPVVSSKGGVNSPLTKRFSLMSNTAMSR